MKSATTMTLIVYMAGCSLQVTAGERLDDWHRVSTLNPGTEIIVTAGKSMPVTRYFVAADDSTLTVLNLGDPPLPAAAGEVFRQAASAHPEYFLAAQRGGQFVLGHNVGMGPDGVFVASRIVAGLAQVIEAYGEAEIIEVRIAMIDSNPVGCAVAGFYGGGLIGGLPGAVIGGAIGRDTGPALLGMMAGWSLGSVHIFRACRHTPEKIIYSTR